MKCEGEADALTEEIAAFSLATVLADVPYNELAGAKTLVLDALAVSLSARSNPLVTAVRSIAKEQGGKAEAGLWGARGLVPAPEAAFVNGVAAAVLDFDSVNIEANVHPLLANLPAALAIAEKVGASGRDFLAALIVGAEVTCRLGLAAPARKGWYHTALFGVFGSAVASSKLLQLERDGFRHALGHALGCASGTQQAAVERSPSKFVLSASAARNGVNSALLAARGITAPAAVFQGQFGFESLYTDLDSRLALEGLGEKWRFAETGIKKYPCCAGSHSAIDVILHYRAESPELVVTLGSITVRISPFAARLVGGRYVPGSDPQVAAQFSIQYAIACALIRGRFELRDLDVDAATDPKLVALAQAIKVITDKSIAEFTLCLISIKRNDGTEVKLSGQDPFVRCIHQRANLVAADKLIAAAERMGAEPSAAEDLIACIDTLDDGKSVAELSAVLAQLVPEQTRQPKQL